MWPLAMHVPPDVLRAGTSALTRAVDRAHLKRDAAAALMGISPQQLAQWEHGIGHISLCRLLMLAADPDGRACLAYLVRELGLFAGLEDVDALAHEAARLTRAVERLRQAVLARRMAAVRRTVQTARQDAEAAS